MTADVCESEIANGNGNSNSGVEVEHSERDVTPTINTSTSTSQDQDQDLAKTTNENNAKDDFDGSYVFVNGTDAKDKDLLDSDLNVETDNNVGLPLDDIVAIDHPQPEAEVNDLKIENKNDQTAHNGGAEAAEFNVDKVEGGEEIHETHASSTPGDKETETVAIDQPEQPAHNGHAEAEAEADAAEFNVDKVKGGEEIHETHASSTTGDKETEAVALDQPEQPAHNGHAEAEADTAEFNVDKVEGGEEIHETHASTIGDKEKEPEQPAHDGEAEAEAAEFNVCKVEGREELHETLDNMINLDKPDLAADLKQHQESDFLVNNVESATNQEKEQAESFNEVSLGDSPGSPPAADNLGQDPAIAPSPGPKTESDVVINKIPVSDESCDGMPAAVSEQEGALESVLVHENPAEQSGSSENVESSPTPVICGNASPAEIGPSSPTAVDNEQPLSSSEEAPVEASQGDDGVDSEHSLETPSYSKVDKTIEIQVSDGPLSEENEEGLPAGLAQENISETVVITDLVDASQNTTEQDESSENAERLTTPSDSCNVLESGESFPDDAPVNKIIENSVVEDNVSLPAGDLPICDVEDVRPETDTEKSNQKNIENPESLPVENENIPVDPKSIFPTNDVRSQHEICSASSGVEETISTDAIVVESENSNRTAAECASNQLMSCTQTNEESVSHISTLVDHYSSSPASLVSVEVKLESEVDNTSIVRGRDMPSDNVLASEGEDSDAKSNVQLTCQEVSSNDRNQKDEASTSFPEDSSEGQNVGVEVVKRPFYFLIRIPRYDDEKLREEIKLAQLKVEERTRSRDSIRSQIQMKRATVKEYSDIVQALLTEERAARDLFKSKRQEIDSCQFVINKVKNAMSVEDIDGRIRNMEHMIEHETLPLREEKQLIREIKQLKQQREQISSSMGKQDEIQQALDQKDQIEERLKVLRKELDQLRDNLTKAEEATKTARKRYNEEMDKLNESQSQFNAADGIRQEAYAHLQSLKKQQYEKNKNFWRYKDDVKAAQNLSLSGDREQLQRLCLDQVERTMELWNRNDDFRREYIKSNTRSTLRRLRTLDGRSLGPDEEPPVIPDIVYNRVTKDNSVRPTSIQEEVKQDVPIVVEKQDNKSVAKVVERKNQTAKTETAAKPASSGKSPATISGEDEMKEREEEPRRTKEEEELARKAEELRKEEEAAKLKQQRKLEEKAKAKEAMDRKRRTAEKNRARAEMRAKKEAEEKEKEREKRAKKKEKKKMVNGTDDVTNEEEGESALTPSLEIPANGVAPNEAETREKAATTTVKRPHKGSQFIKQSKTKSMPLPLRNRGKRRMQPWMWVALTLVVVLAFFLIGSSGFSFKSFFRWFGF